MGEGTNKDFAFLQSDEINHHCAQYFTVLEEDVFCPKGFYIGNGDKPIVFDSGCSIARTPFKDDFLGKITPVQKIITGLSSISKVEGEGIVEWSLYNDYGFIQHIKVKENYIPSSTVRLFIPQHYFQQEMSVNFKIDTDGCVFTFSSGKTLKFTCTQGSNLLIALTTKRNNISKANFAGKAYLVAASSGKLNTSRAQE